MIGQGFERSLLRYEGESDAGYTSGILQFSVKPVPRSFRRALRTFRRTCRSQLIAGDAAVAVPVESQDERARLVDKLFADNLAILVLVKIAEVCVCQCCIGLLDGGKLGRVELSIAVAVRRRKKPISKTLPFFAGVDAVAVGVPNRGAALEEAVLGWLGGGLSKGKWTRGQK